MSQDKQEPHHHPSTFRNFLIGGISGMFATSCIQPMDFIKVQQQIRGEGQKGGRVSPLTIAKETYSKFGPRKFYTGLDAALMRQAVYGTARMGIFKTLMDWCQETYGSVSYWQKAAFGLTSGALGSVIGNPTDISLVRMQTDNTLPEAKRRNYKGIFDALYRIIKEEGVLTLWRGATPTIYRAMALNYAMLSTNAQAVELLERNFGQFNGIYVEAALIAAFFACSLSLPFDNVKTKFQRMVPNEQGVMPYKGFGDCFMTSLRKEGVLGLYVGFNAYLLRTGPHIVIMLLVSEFLNKTFNS